MSTCLKVVDTRRGALNGKFERQERLERVHDGEYRQVGTGKLVGFCLSENSRNLAPFGSNSFGWQWVAP